MSLLFVSASWPHPLSEFRHGTAQRMRLLLRAAALLDMPLDVMFFGPQGCAVPSSVPSTLRNDLHALWQVPVREVVLAEQGVDVTGRQLWTGHIRPSLNIGWQPGFAPMAGAHQAAALRNALQRLKPRLLVVHRLGAMLPALRLADTDLPPVVLDLDDIEHKAFSRSLALPPHWRAKALMKLWIPALRAAEGRAVRRSTCALVCSEADVEELSRTFRTNKVVAIPNAAEVPHVTPELAQGKCLLFLGVYSYAPNRVAAERLIHEIWPLVRRRHPDGRLLIAGRGHHLIHGHQTPGPGVEVLGFVDDLEALYARARVVACPIISGGGTRIKIIEAAMRARPVVSTRIGAEGLDLRAEAGEIVIADTAVDFADAVGKLFDDDEYARQMGNRAQSRVIERYDEANVRRRLADVMRQALRS